MSVPQEEFKPLYIPTHLNVIGYMGREGGTWQRWDEYWGKPIQSHEIKRVPNYRAGDVTLRCEFLFIHKNGYYAGTVHALLFEKGYMWDVINGWRQIRLDETTLDVIKQRWLFEN